MQTILFKNNKRYTETSFTKEREFKELVFNNSKLLFGESTILICLKKQLGTFFGGTIPDFFLIDLNNSNNPEFYLVEVELASHDFFSHIFPQITKFFAFFRNPASQKDLIKIIYSLILLDKKLETEIKSRIPEIEINKFLTAMIEDSQNILLILDNEKKELPEINETYTETWGKTVKQFVLKQFTASEEVILSLTPDFKNIEIAQEEGEAESGVPQRYSSEYQKMFYKDKGKSSQQMVP